MVQRGSATVRVGLLAAIERTVPFWPLAWIERRQRRQLRAIVRHAYETVPFYRTAMDERRLRPDDFRTIDDLARLPLIDGKMIRENPGWFLSSCYDERTRRIFHTSGALTRVRKTIYWDDAGLLCRLAHEERDRPILARLVGRNWGQRQLFILPEHSASLRRRRLLDQWVLMPRGWVARRFIAPDLPMEAVVAALAEFRPDVVFSYGSYADLFFRSLANRRHTAVLPRVWVYNSDMLSPGGRHLMEQGFGVRVYSTYQAVETGRLGFECERGQGFHLNIDLCAMRLVDEAGQTVPPGESGEVIISNLHNRAMVLLNYRLGDRAVFEPAPCACERSLPRLARLEGRISDVIVMPDGRKLSSLVVEMLLRDELTETLSTQLMQDGDGRLTWFIVPFAGTDRAALRQAIVARARAVLHVLVDVTIEFVDDIPPTPQGKRLKVRPAAIHGGR